MSMIAPYLFFVLFMIPGRYIAIAGFFYFLFYYLNSYKNIYNEFQNDISSHVRQNVSE